MNIQGYSEEVINVTRNDILENDYISKTHYEKIKNAEIIVLPYDNFRNEKLNYYPESSMDYIDFLASYIEDKIEYAVDDDNYNELELHSIDIRIPLMFIGKKVAIKIILKNIMNYVKNKRGNQSAVVTFELIQETEKGSTTIKYKGPVEGLEKVIENVK